jgi:tetratricopeptide (TPR) repeat protein
LRAHHPDEAISALQKGLKIVPIASAERELAMAYQAKGMQREADQAWQRANELEQKK